MSLSSSLYSGISGLNANTNAMSVIGNNIANANTSGFKSGRANFSDVISQSLSSGSNPNQIGRGAQISSISNSFTQGSLESTSSATDLALEGDGFFIVNDGLSSYYTRAGQFSADKNRNLVNTDGLTVQGWDSDSNGNPTGAIKDINFANASATPQVTSSVTLNANLDSRETIAGAFNLADPAGTSNFSSGLTVYDSLGNAHTVICYFSKTAANAWDWNAVVDGSELTSGLTEIEASGTLSFTTSGELDTETTTVSDFNFAGGSALNQVINFDFGDSLTTDGGTGLSGSTQFGADSAVSLLDQDGFTSGTLQSISVDQDGIITGFFTNGKTQPLAIVAVATFQNQGGLNKVGSNLFSETFATGQPVITMGGVGGSGKVQSNSLEQSNVDLAEEFVKMITTQRAFQANSRTITTTDEMMAEIINIKR